MENKDNELQDFLDDFELDIKENAEEVISEMEIPQEDQKEIEKEYFKELNPENCTTTKELVQVFLANGDYNLGLASIKKGKKTMDFGSVKNRFLSWTQLYRLDSSMTTDRQIDAAFNILFDDWYDNEVSSLEKTLCAQISEEEGNKLWEEVIKNTQWTENDIIVLKSWMYNVKHILINGVSGEQVPMPVFYSSAQGIGKSFFTKLLKAPFGGMAQDMDVGTLNDTFFKPMFGKLIIADFDEMAGFDKADVNTFKKWATAEKTLSRVMRSQVSTESLKITQPIGSSNKPIEAIIGDTTGSRRFWQINFPVSIAGWLKEKQEKKSFMEFSIKLWQSIDMTESNPYREHRATIESISFNEQRRKSDVEEFIEHYILSEVFDDCIQSSKLFKKYKEYCLENNNKFIKSSTGFGLAMKEKPLCDFIEKKKTKGVMVFKFDKEQEAFKFYIDKDKNNSEDEESLF